MTDEDVGKEEDNVWDELNRLNGDFTVRKKNGLYTSGVGGLFVCLEWNFMNFKKLERLSMMIGDGLRFRMKLYY